MYLFTSMRRIRIVRVGEQIKKVDWRAFPAEVDSRL